MHLQPVYGERVEALSSADERHRTLVGGSGGLQWLTGHRLGCVTQLELGVGVSLVLFLSGELFLVCLDDVFGGGVVYLEPRGCVLDRV